MCFVDYRKAFDVVNRNFLWKILKKNGIPEDLIAAIQSLYENNKIVVEITNSKYQSSEINNGVRQGCPLSPALFNVFIDEIVEQWKLQLRYNFKMNNTNIDTILFADDQVIIANSEDKLQYATYKLNEIAYNYELEISITKTKVLAFKGDVTIRAKIVLKI